MQVKSATSIKLLEAKFIWVKEQDGIQNEIKRDSIIILVDEDFPKYKFGSEKL